MTRQRITSALLAGVLAMIGGLASAADIVTTANDRNTKVTMLNDRDLMIQAASESAAIQLHFNGADRIEFGMAGELIVMKSNGGLVRYRPDVYQMIKGKLHPVTVSYRLAGKDRVTMNFEKFDKSKPVIVRRGAATL